MEAECPKTTHRNLHRILEVRLAELEKEVELRRALDTFRLDVFEPFRQSVDKQFHNIQWTWAALTVAIPALAGLLVFLVI
jgi:hypothetical protein